MKDIPIFTSPFGMATLILREIPTKQYAYVMVRSHQEGKLPQLLEECRAFCAMAGAVHVLATADEPLDFLPHVHDMLAFTCRREALPPPLRPVELAPVTAENGAQFLALYNRLFYPVINAATYTQTDLTRVLEKGQAYLALVGGQVAGLGELTESELCAIAVAPEFRGLGHRLALTLFARMSCEVVHLRVSSANEGALRLYGRLGFDRSSVLSRWYRLTPTAE